MTLLFIPIISPPEGRTSLLLTRSDWDKKKPKQKRPKGSFSPSSPPDELIHEPFHHVIWYRACQKYDGGQTGWFVLWSWQPCSILQQPGACRYIIHILLRILCRLGCDYWANSTNESSVLVLQGCRADKIELEAGGIYYIGKQFRQN